MLKHTYVNNKKIYVIPTKSDFLNYIKDRKKILIAINAKKIVLNDSAFDNMTNEHIAYPDGSGTVKALKKKGCDSIKYPGYILWHDIVKSSYKSKTFYLIGSSDIVIKETVNKLNTEFPGIKILNYKNGFFSPSEFEDIKFNIKDKKPDVVFVAMAFPRQDKILYELYQEFPALYLGLGGSFNVYTGQVPAVPDWWIKYFKSEALYRLIKDPTKIKRQKDNLKFLYYYYMNKL